MSKSELGRDKAVTREVNRLFWQAMFFTPRYFITLLIFYPLAFFVMQAYIPLQIAYGIQVIITRHFDQVGHYAWLVFWLTVLGQVLNTIATWAFNRNGIYGGTFVQRTIFANYLSKDYEFFTSQYVGALGAQAARIRDAFTDYNRLALFEVPRNLVIVFASLGILATKSLALAGISVLCMAIVLGITVLFAELRLKYRRQVSQASSEIAAAVGDTLSHGSTVKSFAGEDFEHQRLEKSLKKWEIAQRKSWDFFLPQNAARNISMGAAMVILLVVSANLYHQGKISIAIIALVQIYVIRLINVTIDTADMIKAYELIMSAAYQTVATSLIKTTVTDPPKSTQIFNKKSYDVSFDSVDYHYPEAAVKTLAVRDFSLAIKNGEKIGLVGYSGGGKTTITKLLLRFMDVSGGAIKIDGLNIKNLKQADLRRLIAYVPQEPLLFHRSIKENIAYGQPDATEKEILVAARTAHVDEFVSELPNGYNSLVGERGVKLSGGQRQRVAIARALLKDAPILVLDEATSALDSESERYIQKALWELMKDRTAVVIAHRLSTIQHLDRIVVMDKGRIVEIGTHEQLLKTKSGIYSKLWARQSGGYLA